MNTEETAAGLGSRLGARILDGLIVAPVIVIGQLLMMLADSVVLGVVGWLLVLLGVGFAFYNQVVRVGRRGHSIGRQILGVRILDQDTRQPLGVGRAFVRDLVLSLLFAACLIPGIVNVVIAARDRRRQGWHDKAARSVVVPATAPTGGTPQDRAASPAEPQAPSLPTAASSTALYNPSAPPVASTTTTPPPPIPPGDGAPPTTPPSGVVGPPPGVVPPPPAPDLPVEHTIARPRDDGDASPGGAEPGAPARRSGWTLTTPTGNARVVEGLLLIGRDPDPSLVDGAEVWAIDDPHLTMSKTHALLGLENGTAWVEDWHSTNGVALHRGEAALVIEPHARTPLRDGDVIEFGGYKVAVEDVS